VGSAGAAHWNWERATRAFSAAESVRIIELFFLAEKEVLMIGVSLLAGGWLPFPEISD